jgi:predicted DCC family thiol-disulfide oxidoreductase YuxK
LARIDNSLDNSPAVAYFFSEFPVLPAIDRGRVMTTAVRQSGKYLAFDGDCPMCTSTIALLLRLKLVRPEQTRSNHDLEGDDLQSIRAAGIRNQLVVLDPDSRETRAGSDGLVWLIGDNLGNPWWMRVWTWPGFRQVLSFGYEAISYNRRVISPPRHRIACDCEPEVTLARRMALVVPVLLLTFLLAAAFGACVLRGWRLDNAIGGIWFVPAALGAGLVPLALVALVSLRGEQRIDYLAHLAITTFAGTAVLLPFGLAALFLPREAATAIVCLSGAGSLAMMFFMQRRRVAAVGLGGRWLWGWLASLSVGFGLVAYVWLGRA